MTHTVPPNNDRFLDVVFPNPADKPLIFTASWRGMKESGSWARNPFACDPQSHNFFCVSTIGGDGRRTPANAVALHVLMVDDVGTKVQPERVLGILGWPTYSIETSQGNHQWGFLLKPPVTDPTIAEALVRAVATHFTPDAAGRNRMARLPYGLNRKADCPDGFETRLVRWDPDTWLTGEQALARLETVPVPAEELVHPGALPMESDPTIAAMELIGHPFSPTRTAGIYTVQCPWVAEHTGGRDDGAAYISPHGFNCFHGHCHDKTYDHFRTFLGLSKNEIDMAVADHEFSQPKFKLFAADASGFHAKEVSIAPPQNWVVDEQTERVLQAIEGVEPKPQHRWLSETMGEFAHPDGRFFSRKELQERFPIEWLFQDVVPMGVPWCIAGEGGLGKSRIMLSLCMSIASGVPWGNDFVPGDPNGGPVIFFTQEDDKPQRGRRSITQYEYLCQRDARWDSDEVRKRLQRNLILPSLEWGQPVNTTFRSDFKAMLAEMPVPPRLVVFDPMVLFWDHSDKESSINSAAGAVNTMRLLLNMVRNGTDHPFSVAVCHHISKEGEVYGSAILKANLRLVFTVEMNGDQVEMKVAKVNSSNIAGKVYGIDRWQDGTAAVFPTELFGGQTHEELLATLLHQGKIKWDQPESGVVQAAREHAGFGAPDDRETNVRGVLASWHKSKPGAKERLERLGLEHAPYNKYRPISMTGESDERVDQTE